MQLSRFLPLVCADILSALMRAHERREKFDYRQYRQLLLSIVQYIDPGIILLSQLVQGNLRHILHGLIVQVSGKGQQHTETDLKITVERQYLSSKHGTV